MGLNLPNPTGFGLVPILAPQKVYTLLQKYKVSLLEIITKFYLRMNKKKNLS